MFGTSATAPLQPLNAHAVTVNVAPDSFGQVLHELVEKGKKGESLHVKFTEHFVIVQMEEKFCCYPIGFVKTILPRYRICDVTLARAAVNKLKIYLGWLAILSGHAMIIGGSKFPEALPNGMNFVLIGIGVLFLLVGILVVVLPFFAKKYLISFKLLPDKHGDTFKGSLAFSKTHFHISTHKRPDESFLLEYVYGPLVKLKGMDQHHVASHLINNNILGGVQGKIEFPSMKVIA